MTSHYTAIRPKSLEHKERYDIIIPAEERYILVNVYETPSGSGKYIRFGLRIETGAERTTIIIVDIFDIIQQVRDTGIHLKGYCYSRPRTEEQ